jgi:hypothetical protein
MVDWKKYRESIGYTQAKVSKDANAWHRLALGYHAAAQILNELSERIPSDTRPFAFNAALSIELIIKAILAGRASKSRTSLVATICAYCLTRQRSY